MPIENLSGEGGDEVVVMNARRGKKRVGRSDLANERRRHGSYRRSKVTVGIFYARSTTRYLECWWKWMPVRESGFGGLFGLKMESRLDGRPAVSRSGLVVQIVN